MAAFQALGPFISTFADPAITALLHNENGEIIITDAEQLAERLNILEQTRSLQRESSCPPQSSSSNSHSILNTEQQNTVNNNTDDLSVSNTVINNLEAMDEREDEWSAQLVATSSPKSLEERRANMYFESTRRGDNPSYSTFLYWREPVAALDLVDIELDASEANIQDTEMRNVESKLENDTSEIFSFSKSSSPDEQTETPSTSRQDKTEGHLQHTAEVKQGEEVNHIDEEVQQVNNIDEEVQLVEEEIKLIEVTDEDERIEETKEYAIKDQELETGDEFQEKEKMKEKDGTDNDIKTEDVGEKNYCSGRKFVFSFL